MNRFRGVRRQADQWSSDHARARSRAAERIDVALDPAEEAWLVGHLAACAACQSVAAAYDADRLALRALRDITPEPPRDLWARTAARIERESGARGRSIRAGSGTRLPLGALSGIVVIAIVLGATALSGGWFLPRPDGETASLAAGAARPGATPMLVAAGSVTWLRRLEDGEIAYNVAALDEVCPVGDQPNCAALSDQAFERLNLQSAPKSVIGSPIDGQAVVVGQDASGRQTIVVVSLPKAAGTTQAPTSTPKPTSTPTPAETATAPVETAGTSPSVPPETIAPPTEPPATPPLATASIGPSEEPTQSTTPPATTEPSPTVTPVASPSESLAPTPEATLAQEVGIATGVSVVGESAAFSANGAWFAFTARPADGSGGPDIFVWHVGDPKAHRLTTDGASVFASWQDGLVIGSGLAADDQADRPHEPVSFRIDPATGVRTDVSDGLWRPAVDPSGTYAVAWDGTVVVDASDPADMSAGRGDLRLVRWPADGNELGTAGEPVPGASGPVSDFDVRWDETGSWLAVWVSDSTDGALGRLTLLRLDREAGRLLRPDGAPTDVPALSGFSIGDGRLAWVTPHGQDAQGSKVQVVAWSGDGVGATESVPGEDVVVVR